MKAWTDYPFTALGDTSGQIAPIREIEVLSYDRDKYCRVRVEGHEDEIKAGYIYQKPGRVCEVPPVRIADLLTLPPNGVLSGPGDNTKPSVVHSPRWRFLPH